MRRSKSVFAVAAALFCVVEILLGIRFQTNGEHGALLRYITVILACLFCILFAERSWEYLLTQLALVMTVCADWFLVLPSPPVQLPGMIFFSAVQMAYAARLYLSDENGLRRKWQIRSRVLVSAVAMFVTAAVLGRGTDAVALISLFYYANLALNIVFACVQFRRQAVMAVGLMLFLCCDTLVGLAFLEGYLTIAEDSLIHWINHLGLDLAWAFYLPSQMLLAASLFPARWKQLAAPVSVGGTLDFPPTERRLS